MHIAYYAPAWPAAGASNGIVTYVAAMRDQMLAQGHRVSVIAQGVLYTDDGGVHPLGPDAAPRSWWSRLRGRMQRDRGDHPGMAALVARQMRHAHEAARFDLLEMEESFGWSLAVQRQLPVPVVTRLHGPQFLRSEGAGTAAQRRRRAERVAGERRAFRAARAVSAPTAATMAAAVDRYAHRPELARVILNPVATDDAAAARWRPPGGTGTKGDIILFVGRIDLTKGADTVIEAFARVAAVDNGARLVMIGPDEGLALGDGRCLHFADYVSQYVEPGIGARIAYLGPQPRRSIAEWRLRASVTVAASRHETFHYAAVEAMAVGSPIVSTAWAGSDEVIDDGVTGWLTPVADPEALAERILWVLENPVAAARAGDAAWRHCRDRFAPARIGGASLAFYDDVLAHYAPGR